MKYIGLIAAVGANLIVGVTAIAQNPTTAVVSNADGLPSSGTYFITNEKSGEALQPVAPTLGQNVMTAEFNKGGLQKWVVTRKIDPKTKKPLNRYTVRLDGETPGLNFEPHPSVANATAIISSDVSVYSLDKLNGNYVIKSVARNGDALFIYPSPPGPTEAHFEPSDGSDKFRWSFLKAD